jgi:hypothetical protein
MQSPDSDNILTQRNGLSWDEQEGSIGQQRKRSTIARIYWIIHGTALQSLPTCQIKINLQLIHNWLLVKGHPGRTCLYLICPIYKNDTESKRKLSEVPTYSSSMETSLVSKINEPLHTQHGPLALILQWALANCHDKDSRIPHDLEELQDDTIYPGSTNLLQAHLDIGWHQAKGTMGHIVDPIHRDVHTRTGENYLTKLIISIWNY